MSEGESKESFQVLISKYKRTNNQRLLDDLIIKLMPIVENIAARFIKDRNIYEDVRQVAYIGMLKAIESYDEDKGLNFFSHLTPKVVGEIKHFYRDNDWVVKIPRRLKETNFKIYKLIPELAQKHNRTVTPKDIADYLNMSIEEVIEAMSITQNYDILSLENTILVEDSETPITLRQNLGELDKELERLEDISEIKEIYANLTSLDKKLVKFRYLDKLTQKEIADILGVSQMQVSRLLGRLKTKTRGLRNSMNK